MVVFCSISSTVESDPSVRQQCFRIWTHLIVKIGASLPTVCIQSCEACINLLQVFTKAVPPVLAQALRDSDPDISCAAHEFAGVFTIT